MDGSFMEQVARDVVLFLKIMAALFVLLVLTVLALGILLIRAS